MPAVNLGANVGGSIASIFIGRSDDERAALMRLISREDEVFSVQPGEAASLGGHIQADIQRFMLLDARQKLSDAIFSRKSDRNLYATLAIGVVLFIKTGLSWHDIATFFASL